MTDAEIIIFPNVAIPAEELEDVPEADCIRKDMFGRPLYLYALEYEYADGVWALDLWAYNETDALARVSAMQQRGVTYRGQVMAVMPA